MRIAVALAPILLATIGAAQIPTQCLEIERILVDACIDLSICPAAQEGQNEMVTFRVGPTPIALSELATDWPNNSWNGLVQDGTTAGITAQLNSTIVGCGFLIEPPSGIIPAGARVLMVSSTAMCAAANPFTNLVDTLHIIFQAPGNTSGHFANHNNGTSVSPSPSGGSALRTLVLIYLPTNCSDTATYDRELLTNIYGTYGGATAENDGATAVFTWPGTPQVSYVNFGCQAPFVPNDAVIQVLNGSLCNGAGQVLLTATTTGPYQSGVWSGGTGTFTDPNSIGTTYFAGAGDTGDVTLTFTASFGCGPDVVTTITIVAATAPTVLITADGPTALCPGQSVTLTASGADNYMWNTSEPEATITVSTPGTYSVTGTSACGQGTATIDITTANGPEVIITPDGPTTICAGESVTLTASGADTYLWNTQETSASITVTQPGTYSVVGTNACGTGGATIDITESLGPTVTITPSGSTALCPGQSVTLTAAGADTYLWNTLEVTPSIVVSTLGTISVTGTNACGQATATIDITTGSSPDVSIIADGPTTICPGDSVTLTATGADSYLWSTQETSASITVGAAGLYSVTGTNACGADVENIMVDVIQVNASFTADVTTGMAPLTVVFTNTSTPAIGFSEWDFGDDNTSTAVSPTNTFADPGSYTVVLAFTDQGCVSFAQITVTVLALPDTATTDSSAVSVPTVFSPNNDGINDVLLPTTLNITTLDMVILNRWGQQVAHLQWPQQAWDAHTFAGEPASDGTYFYVLKAQGADGKAYDLKGSITLLR